LRATDEGGRPSQGRRDNAPRAFRLLPLVCGPDLARPPYSNRETLIHNIRVLLLAVLVVKCL
jgi:hypothetical protein